MRHHKHPRGARQGRAQRTFERLEVRELLTADTMPPLMAHLPMIHRHPPADVASLDASIRAPRAMQQLPADAQDALVQAVGTVLSANGMRSVDGTGNNLAQIELGSVGEQLLRAAEADYSDGISTPAGQDRPSPREISNALAAQSDDTTNSRDLSAFIYAWGQFIDHDIDLTTTQDNGETFPIAVPAGDPYFDPTSTGARQISLTRSQYDPSSGTGVDNPRAQINEITAWIDGSMVYGSNQVTADSLRTFVGGKLLTSDGNLPPTDADGNFLAGDIRANENVELTAMHTLFVREHNRWADQIAQRDPALTDEEIYQQARAIVIAEIQAITFNEFLPALLGKHAIDRYQGYDPSVDPSIANEFSTAAFRMHTLINDDVEFFGNDGRAVAEEVSLAGAFFNPDLLRETGADPLLKYLASTQSQEFDLQMVDSLRNFLFGQPGSGGFDLASLNIQRGRDHGLADYNSVRAAYGLARVESFADISSDPQIQQTLEELYGSVDNIDLWVGALAEDQLPGSSVGELTRTIVADQFERLRDGDRFWYQNIFSGPALRQIETTSLADIIARNTTIDNLQDNVFFMRADVTGGVFIDRNENGRRERGEEGLAGVTVELLDDEGMVVASTITNSRGDYRFDAFAETGDYQIRVVVPEGASATGNTTVDMLISAGDDLVRGINFGIAGELDNGGDEQMDRARHNRHRHHVDTVFASDELLDSLIDPRLGRGRR